MKIEIVSSAPDKEYKIYKIGDKFPVKNLRSNQLIGNCDFSENDILNLLGDKKYAKFENGIYVFDVTKNHLDLITGERSPRNRTELEMYKD